MIKKLLSALLAMLMFTAVFCGCKNDENNDNGKTDTDTALGGDDKTDDDDDGKKDEDKDDGDDEEDKDKDDDDEGKTEKPTAEELLLNANYTAGGYVEGKISDFSVYENTKAYRTVTTAEELIQAIADAKYHYKNVWETSTYTQEPADGYTEDNFEGTVHVIEIANDLNLGYYKLRDELSDKVKAYNLVDDFGKNIPKWTDYISMSDMVLENGISQIKVENTSNLLIYSKNGAKLTHCGFKLTSDTNVVFRNLTFDEMWQWEDAPTDVTDKIGDYDWFGWAYFKISFCGYIWIDHCNFGKSYDGQIDYSNPVYNANAGTASRAPYGADGSNGLHISWCNFNAGSDDKDGYLYKMMSAIEEDYQSGGTQYLYYNALREGGASFEDILYGIAIPQKKGFLCGDNAKFSGSYDNADDYNFNLKLRVSFANCTFKNLEDRLPKLRGGNAYMYNCIVDSSQYYGYRTKLRGISAASKVASVNSGWKCGLVSQGIVCGNGGSVKAENCIFKGIEYLLKNNDTNNSAPYSLGGYQLVNCSYQQSATSTVYTGSSSDTGNSFTNSSTTTLTTDKFEWHTKDKTQPFTISAIGLENLEDMLKSTFDKSYLKSSYSGK